MFRFTFSVCQKLQENCFSEEGSGEIWLINQLFFFSFFVLFLKLRRRLSESESMFLTPLHVSREKKITNNSARACEKSGAIDVPNFTPTFWSPYLVLGLRFRS